MTDNLRQRIEQIYLEALDIPAGDRPGFLDRSCVDDRALRSEVEALLALQSSAEAFLEQPAIESAARTLADILPALRPPEIPGYKIIRHLGEGGMGLVYLAEQEAPLRRLVALKLIKPGMDTRQVVARFETERQALALMDHPNIAAVFDAGATADGRPYFVMEFVEGVTITEYCDRGRLSTSDRLALFVQVCAAVQHAHQKGVIHRDLKPSNVLVTERDGHALPKVIDFGTAKAIGGAWNATATPGGQGMVLGTLEYMSPEQAALSADIDAATDVYSLGVLLYELLAGRLPFDTDELRAAGYDEIRRVIRESDPPRPSVRVGQRSDKSGAAARARQTDTPGLTRQLRGDLDRITLKALEKDRKRRYATAAAFATDIGRFLDDQPVEARPPSSTYRIRKFAKRHRGAVAAAVSLFVVLVAGLAASGWQYLRAEHARMEIHRLDAERRLMEMQQALAPVQDLAAYRNYVITIAAADGEVRAHRFSEARGRLLTVPVARRGWEWDHLFVRADSMDGTVRGEALQGSGVTKLNGSTPTLGVFAQSADGRMVANGSLNGSVTVWHPEEHRQVLVQPPVAATIGHGVSLSMAIPLSDNRTILTGLRTLGSVMRWDSETGQSVSLPTIDRLEPGCVMGSAGAAVSPNERYLAISQGECVVVRDLATARTVATLRVDRPGFDVSFASYVGFLSDESILVTARHRQQTQRPSAASNSAMRWNWTRNRVYADRLFPIPTANYLVVASSPGGRRIALGLEGFATIWDGLLDRPIGRIPIATNPGPRITPMMAMSMDGARLAIATNEQTSVLIWDTATSQVLLTLTDDDAHTYLAFTPSGQLIAANASGGLTIWETQRRKPNGAGSAR
jgi:serine/threonine protein kinase/WD40 repeat protein